MRIERVEIGKESCVRFYEDKAGIFYQEKMMPRLPVLVSGRWISHNEVEFTAPLYAQSLDRILKGPISSDILDRILDAFEESIGLLENYLLDKEKLWWDPAWIFFDSRESRIYLVYLPWEETAGKIGIEKQLCRYLWVTAARQSWGKDLWERIGRFSVRIYGSKAERIEKLFDPEKEKALDDLMSPSVFLPPLQLKSDEEKAEPGFFQKLKTEISSILHGW